VTTTSSVTRSGLWVWPKTITSAFGVGLVQQFRCGRAELISVGHYEVEPFYPGLDHVRQSASKVEPVRVAIDRGDRAQLPRAHQECCRTDVPRREECDQPRGRPRRPRAGEARGCRR
jgi:hypothetical protein